MAPPQGTVPGTATKGIHTHEQQSTLSIMGQPKPAACQSSPSLSLTSKPSPTTPKQSTKAAKTKGPQPVQGALLSPPPTPFGFGRSRLIAPSPLSGLVDKSTKIWPVGCDDFDSLHPAPAPIHGTLQDWLKQTGLGEFPKTSQVDRAAWEPFLEALGLKVGIFPAIQVKGKTPQEGKRGKEKKAEDWDQYHEAHQTKGMENLERPTGNYFTPDWNYLIYVILAVAPEGRLKLSQIFHLCITWCPQRNPKNDTCRHCLSVKNFVNVDEQEGIKTEKAKIELGGYWRIQNAGEYKKGVVGKQGIQQGGKKEKKGGSGSTRGTVPTDAAIFMGFVDALWTNPPPDVAWPAKNPVEEQAPPRKRQRLTNNGTFA